MDAFDSLFIGSAGEAHRAILDACGGAAYRSWFGGRLRQSCEKAGTATTARTVRLFSTWFNLGLPVGDLLDIACLDEAGPRFDPVAVAKAIAATWVAAPPEPEGTGDAALRDWGAPPSTVGGQFARAILDMAGMIGRQTNARMPRSVILEAFDARFPDRAEAVSESFGNGGASDRQALSKLVAALRRNDPAAGSAKANASVDAWIHVRSLDDLGAGDRELLDMVGDQLRGLRPRLKELGGVFVDNEGRERVAAASPWTTERGIVLTEETWTELYHESNHEQLGLAVLLFSLPGLDKRLWDLRFAILENPVLRREMTRRIFEPRQDGESGAGPSAS